MTKETRLVDVHELISEFVGYAREELDDRLKKFPPDLSNCKFHEVVGGLLARQTTMATEIAMCPNIWNGHIAPIILRSMADAYISLAWVLRDPERRCKQFILYGLGQAKLELEHRRADLANREACEGEKEILDAEEDWINYQRAIFLTEVNLGSWSGTCTRNMAIEGECLDFYNYVYVPFSASTHSMWHHIARYNMRHCQNPLHKYHWVPAIMEVPLDPNYLYLAAKYLRKTFAAVDSATGISSDMPSAFEVLCKRLESFAQPHQEEPASDPQEEL